MFGHPKITRDPTGYDPANPVDDPTLEPGYTLTKETLAAMLHGCEIAALVEANAEWLTGGDA